VDPGTQRHRAWLRAQNLGGGAQATLLDYLGAIDTLELRRKQLESAITELVPGSPYAQTVARLRCLRGVDTLSAVGLCAEIGDFTRFERPGQLMSYVGLVPSENSSGETRRQGPITKTGSRHARRLLIEAAWHYRKTPARGTTLQRRQEGKARTSSRSPGRHNAACTTSGAAWPTNAANAARSSRSPLPANSSDSAGHSPAPTDPPGPNATSVEERRDLAHAREQPRPKHEQPSRPRSILDSRALTTKTGPAAVEPRIRV
jgi:hypothetical protein